MFSQTHQAWPGEYMNFQFGYWSVLRWSFIWLSDAWIVIMGNPTFLYPVTCKCKFKCRWVLITVHAPTQLVTSANDSLSQLWGIERWRGCVQEHRSVFLHGLEGEGIMQKQNVGSLKWGWKQGLAFPKKAAKKPVCSTWVRTKTGHILWCFCLIAQMQASLIYMTHQDFFSNLVIYLKQIPFLMDL